MILWDIWRERRASLATARATQRRVLIDEKFRWSSPPSHLLRAALSEERRCLRAEISLLKETRCESAS